jgi:hypothetical protein
MESRLHFDILPQPDSSTCGPTCLHAVYRYHGDEMPLAQVIRETPALEEGGTLAVLLACHALERGYDATIYTYNLQIFDPTWFVPGAQRMADRLRAQMQVKSDPKLHLASEAYLRFLRLGGRLRMEDLSVELFRRYLVRGVPILTGLSATYLYRESREYGPQGTPDDVRGVPQGHFVVLCGYDRVRREVLLADPLMPNPLSPEHLYEIAIDRVVCAVLLGMITHDANLLVVRPKPSDRGPGRAGEHSQLPHGPPRGRSFRADADRRR